MKRTALAALGLALAACSHASAGPGTAVRRGGPKVALRPIASTAELEASSLPAVFEQSLCSAIFELNDHQVICPDDARAYLKAQRDASLLGAPSESLAQADQLLSAPRMLSLSASRRGARVVIAALLIDSAGQPLGRFEKDVAADGEDLEKKARALAAEVVAVP